MTLFLGQHEIQPLIQSDSLEPFLVQKLADGQIRSQKKMSVGVAKDHRRIMKRSLKSKRLDV